MGTTADSFWNPERREQLVAELLKLEDMASHDFREAMVERLKLSIRMALAGETDPTKVVNTCAQYPGGIKDLVTKIRDLQMGTFWQIEFDRWLNRIGWSVGQGQLVPYVVAAMTQSEAQELPDAIADVDRPRFDAFVDILQLSGVETAEWKAAYGATPGDWQPPLATEQADQIADFWNLEPYHKHTIKDIIKGFFDEFNQRTEQEDAQVSPDDCTDLLFPQPQGHNGMRQLRERERMEAAQKLRQGCILFIDPISLFHPKIITRLRDAEIISRGESVAVLLLTPASIHAIRVNWMVNEAIERLIPSALLRRSVADQFYECGVVELLFLKRRLHAFLTGAEPIPRGKGPRPGNGELLRGLVGSASGEIARVIPGLGGAG